MTKIKILTSLVMFILISCSVVFAQNQPDVSDKELKQYAEASAQIQTMKQQLHLKKLEIVEEGGMTMQRFYEIKQAQQNPNQELKASASEMELFIELNRKTGAMFAEAQQKEQEIIEKTGLTLKRHTEIKEMSQNNPEVSKRLMKYSEPAR